MVISVTDSLIARGLIRIADALSFTITSNGGALIDQRITDWTVEICHEFTVTWADAPALTEFFAKGGQVRMSADRLAGAVHNQNASRSTLLDQIDTIIFNQIGTTGTGILGVNTLLNPSTLTGTYQLGFSATSNSINYVTDMYTLEIKQATPNQITFKACHQDAADQIIDESTNGTITSYVDLRRHVDTAAPIFATTISMAAGT